MRVSKYLLNEPSVNILFFNASTNLLKNLLDICLIYLNRILKSKTVF